MAGPYYYDPENGSEANDGLSELTPRKLIPGQTGAISVTAGTLGNPTILNIKNGTVTSLRMSAPVNYLTYRGYGLADNVLVLTLPKVSNPRELEQVRIVREPGVHEGMWRMENASETLSGFSYLTRTGITVEDLHIDFPSSTQAIALGSSSLAAGAHAPNLRRFEVVNSAGSGVSGYMVGQTVELGRIAYTQDDAVLPNANATNGYRAGYTDRFYGLEIIEPGLNYSTFLGDGFQTQATGGQFKSQLYLGRIYIRKSSAVKQGIVLNDATGGFLVEDFYIECPNDTGTTQFNLSGVLGKLEIRNGYMKRGIVGNAAFRLLNDSGSVITGPSAEISIRNVIVEADVLDSFFTVGASADAATHDGAVTIENCYAKGNNTSALSFSGGISAHPGSNVTIGAGSSLICRNNIILMTGCNSIVLPTGKAGSALYPVENHAFLTDATFAIGATPYADLAAFQAAHNKATGNILGASASALGVIPSGGINKTSALLKAGVSTGLRRAINGAQRQSPPSIGPWDAATLRKVMIYDPAA